MKKTIEEELKKMIDQLKLELKKRVFLFSDKKHYHTSKAYMDDYKYKCLVLAECYYLVEPPTITFYLGSLEEHIKKYLEGIIKHEITHSLGIRDEYRAYKYDKPLELNIFDEKGKYEGTIMPVRPKKIKKVKNENSH